MSANQIDSPQNPKIKSVARLRSSRGRAQQGLIVIDGYREVSRAIACGVTIESIFVPATAGEATIDTQPETWHDAVSSSDARVFLVAERAFEKIAFGQRHEAVAVAKPPSTTLQEVTLTDTAIVAVLEGIEKPGNLGAVLRSADGAGVDAVILVDPVTDLFNPNTIRASLGTVFSLQTATASFAEYKSWADSLQLPHYLARCDSRARSYREVDYTRRCCLAFGSEAYGLSDKWDEINDKENVVIPMAGIADSLNVSVAAAVMFYNAVAARV